MSEVAPDAGDTTGLEARHRALIARDLEVGLMAEAESARAHADRLATQLQVAQERLGRKNARIKQLVARVAELEAACSDESGRPASRLRAGLIRARRP